ncbi:hypothetical protein ACIBKY_55090 [Nonomuraea sp. NPDC050394]|uniref:hypothetical protein n=1 Tax=Nonomuraea sp. NPDC050394 TaxID=3364363 RepID=UPI0037B6F2E6
MSDDGAPPAREYQEYLDPVLQQHPVMRRQSELEPDMTQLSRWGDDHPDLLGGIWWDNIAAPEDMKMCLGIVGDVAAVAAQVRRLLAHPEHLNVIAQRYTRRELRRLQETISDDEESRWQALWDSGECASGEEFLRRFREGPLIVQVGVKQEINKVGLGVSPRDRAFAAALIDRYGTDRVHVYWDRLDVVWF